MIIPEFEEILKRHSLEKDHAGYSFKRFLEEYIKPDSRILDVGCGRRTYGAEYYKLAAWRVGIDEDAEALSENSLMDEKINASIENLDTRHLSSFDLIIAQWVFEHLKEPKKSLAVMNRICKPGGHLIFMTTNLRSPLIFLSKIFPTFLKKWAKKIFLNVAEEDTYPTYYRINTPARIEKLLTESNFERVELVCHPVYTYFGFNKYALLVKIYLDKVLTALKFGSFFQTHIVAVYRKTS